MPNLQPGRVRDPVHGYIPFTAIERAIFDDPVAQRLRYISQSGVAHLVYPEVRTSRFAHSLGAMHLASRFFASAIGDADDGTRQRLQVALRRHPISSSASLAVSPCSAAACRRRSSGTGRGRCTRAGADPPIPSPPSWASCDSAGVSSSLRTRSRRASSSASSGTWRRASSRGDASPASSTPPRVRSVSGPRHTRHPDNDAPQTRMARAKDAVTAPTGDTDNAGQKREVLAF
jgi:hypothetical protein